MPTEQETKQQEALKKLPPAIHASVSPELIAQRKAVPPTLSGMKHDAPANPVDHRKDYKLVAAIGSTKQEEKTVTPVATILPVK